MDLRTIKPIDRATVVSSVTKTGRLLAVDGGWTSFGVSAELAAIATFNLAMAPVLATEGQLI